MDRCGQGFEGWERCCRQIEISAMVMDVTLGERKGMLERFEGFEVERTDQKGIGNMSKGEESRDTRGAMRVGNI